MIARRLLFLAILGGCTPSAPASSPDAPAVDPPPPLLEHASMTMTVREVEEDGWRGRLVDVAFSNGRDRHLRIVPSERPAPLSEIVAHAHPPQPFAAIDGGFYDTDQQPMGLVRAAGVDHHPVGERGGSGILFVRDGRPQIVHRDAYRGEANVSEALQSIDRLVNRGASVVAESASRRRASRSAVVIDGAGAVHLVVAFDERAVASEEAARIELGREATRTGPTIAQWADLLARDPEDGGVGATEALGLDGGFSTSLVVKSEARSLTIVPYNATINAVMLTVNDG
ncbi:MAG: phosphodiester glycosidase family protein [Myxococcales bacterium]|nr:phosphodiester glycosidase family protein [Myxococcales bacterium]